MIAIILGIRPEIIKMSPIFRACETLGESYCTLHSGQHYSYEMDRAFFEDLELPQPEHNLDVSSGAHAKQTGEIMTGIERVLDKPMVVPVRGIGTRCLRVPSPDRNCILRPVMGRQLSRTLTGEFRKRTTGLLRITSQRPSSH